MKYFYETRCKRCDHITTHTFTESDVNPLFDDDDDDDDGLEDSFNLFIRLEKNYVQHLHCPSCIRMTFQDIVSTNKTES